MVEPLKAKPHRGQQWQWAERKFDGVRLLVGRGKALTRSGKTDYAVLMPTWVRRAGDEVLDCEVWVEGGTSSDVKTAILRQGALNITPFAIASRPELDIDEARLAIRRWGFVPPQMFLGYSEEQLLAEARKREWEGFMLKDDHYARWYKLKLRDTYDLLVTGYDVSESVTHFGGLKSLRLSDRTGREVATVGSGFEADFRLECDPRELIGRIAEVECNGVASQGRLRHPRFVRFRDDKTTPDYLL